MGTERATSAPLAFVHDMPSPRVIFGVGAVQEVPVEAQRLGGQRVLVISTGSMRTVADEVSASLGGDLAGRIDRVAMHVPIALADEATTTAISMRTDLLVCLGGGSAIGLAKAIAKSTGIPILAIPTTYAGSEMTSIWGQTEQGRKTTGRDQVVLPRTVIYDPALTAGLPPAVSATSGMNAVAHAVEALYAPDATPVTTLIATEGLRVLAQTLPGVVAHPHELAARGDALYGAWLCGWVLGATRMGLHHTLCHVLGGTYGLPHAAVHSAVLPYVTAWNLESSPALVRASAVSLGSDDPAGAVWDLASSLKSPTSLAVLGFPADAIDAVAESVSATPPVNPRPISFEGVREILHAALEGIRPAPPQLSQ